MRATGRGPGSALRMAKLILLMVAPSVGKALKMGILDRESTMYFRDVIRKSLEHRRRTGERRNDMIDLFIDAMNNADKTAGFKREGQFEKDAELQGETKVSIYASKSMENSSLLLSTYVGWKNK